MPIIDIWLTAPEQFRDKHIQQIIAFSGEGKLQDDSKASLEFREFLSQIPSSFLVRYADECLTTKFDGNGLALQDVINEVGKRLGFSVIHGRYRGSSKHIGFDGLWYSSGSLALICAVSREYVRSGTIWYWFAFHPHQKDFLAEAEEAYVAFGCGSEERIILIPFKIFSSWLDGMNITQKSGRFYWHIHIHHEDGSLVLHRKKDYENILLNEWIVPNL